MPKGLMLKTNLFWDKDSNGFTELDLVWLEVPDNIRKYRFYDRAISKDDITFEEADARDEKLGLKELAESLKDSYIKINN